MRRIIGFLCLALLAGVFAACPDPFKDEVFVDKGSQGEPGNGRVYDLDSGAMYLLKIGRTWYTVTSEGKMGEQIVVLNYLELGARNTTGTTDSADYWKPGKLERLAAGVTEITGLSNEWNLSVYKYIIPNAEGFFLTPDITGRRNTIIDMTHPYFTASSTADMARVNFEEGIEGDDSVFIFLTADVHNKPESLIYSSSPTFPVPTEGGPDWYYEFLLGARSSIVFNPSTGNPFKIWTSDRSGEKGYFNVSGPMPEYIRVRTKRGQGSVGTIGQ